MKSKRIIIFLIFVMLGYSIVIQVKNAEGEYSLVTLRTINDLNESLENEKREISNMKKIIETREAQLIEYQEALEHDGSIRQAIENELKSVKLSAGLKDVEGPGVVVTLNDSERELYDWEDPNDLIIHDGDVLTILNDLKVAGAEAISINGQRLLSDSEIDCSGATITINGITYAQPFIIKAIGNPKTLDAAMKAPNTYAWNLREVYGIVVESEVKEHLTIERYKGNINMRYARQREEN
ncbi:DUF881 domain-containing protein [Serpentinicella sp. ANB-PHB4]|uniref:DUF881 domain-containing protein n=1 Tax=Serpentinicella sp. ANB-PHB4 TaxID=3074076 RepID=UPI00285600DB|nr:DUF881 domain-containing protein [Serpentinicella sp. ANB-PHB4]MDR5658036.1 DUF881 domain-containing protein [Serpentinicella sp. ANB-PHB4]